MCVITFQYSIVITDIYLQYLLELSAIRQKT